MARIADSEIERIKAEVSLVRLVESSGVKLAKRGKDELAGCCPFHADDTPSLSVSVSKNLWRCFGCDAGGGVIDWVMRIEGVSFRHAVELLRADDAPQTATVPVSPRGGAAPPLRSTVTKLPTLSAADDAKLLGEVADYYARALKASPEALAYLAKRGLAHPELIETFRLGFADRTLGYRLPAANRKAGADVRGQLQRLGCCGKAGTSICAARWWCLCSMPAAPWSISMGARSGTTCVQARPRISICPARIAACSTLPPSPRAKRSSSPKH